MRGALYKDHSTSTRARSSKHTMWHFSSIIKSTFGHALSNAKPFHIVSEREMEIRANPRCAGSPMRESNVRRAATTDASREFWKFQLSSSVWRVLEFEALHNRVSKLGDTNTNTRILEISAREQEIMQGRNEW